MNFNPRLVACICHTRAARDLSNRESRTVSFTQTKSVIAPFPRCASSEIFSWWMIKSRRSGWFLQFARESRLKGLTLQIFLVLSKTVDQNSTCLLCLPYQKHLRAGISLVFLSDYLRTHRTTPASVNLLATSSLRLRAVDSIISFIPTVAT